MQTHLNLWQNLFHRSDKFLHPAKVQEHFNESSSAVLLAQFVKPGVRNLVDINLRGKILPLVAAGPQHLNHDSF